MCKPRVTGSSALISSMSYLRCRSRAYGSFTLRRLVMSRNRCSFNAWRAAGFNLWLQGVRPTRGAKPNPRSISPRGSFNRSRVSSHRFTRPWVSHSCGYGRTTSASYSIALTRPQGIALQPRFMGQWTIGVLPHFPTRRCPYLSCTHFGVMNCTGYSTSR